MSVLKRKRSVSKIQYLQIGNFIFDYTANFVSRLSSRFGRILGSPTMRIASTFLINIEMANSIYPNTEDRVKLREKYLIEAGASLNTLDVFLSKCYNIMLTNPQGCFTTTGGKQVPADRAIKRLDSLAQQVGEAIDAERALIRGVIKSDRTKFKNGQYTDNDDTNTDNETTPIFDVDKAERIIADAFNK
jgi:hypothetical protein